MKVSEEYYQNIENARRAYKDGNLSYAIELFEFAMSEIADENDMLDLGILYMENNETSKSLALINNVIDEFPRHARGYYCMGYVLEELDKKEEALNYYKNAYKLEKNSSKYSLAVARMYDEINNLSEAIKYYEITICLDKNNYWAHLNLGSLYERENKLDLALEYTLKAYEIDSNMPMVNYNLGVIYYRTNKYDLSLKHYMAETKVEGCYKLVYYNIGILYKDVFKDYEKAKYYYLKGLYLDKEDISLWYNLGCLYALLKDYNNAYQCLLFVCLKKKKSFSWIEEDGELIEFRKTPQYKKLRNEVN